MFPRGMDEIFTTTFDNYLSKTGRAGNAHIRDAVANLDRTQLFAEGAHAVVEEQVGIKPPRFTSAPTVTIDVLRHTDVQGSDHETIRVTFTIPVAGEVAMLEGRPRDWDAKRRVPRGQLTKDAVRLSFDFKQAGFSKETVMLEYQAARKVLDEVEATLAGACDQIIVGTRVLIDQWIQLRREQVLLLENVQQEIEAALRKP